MNRSAVIAHIAVPLLGVSTGVRSFTPLAVAAWFAREGKLPVQGTWASWLAHPAAVGLLTAGALGECIGDKLPSAPDRTNLAPLLGRVAFGGVLGAILATAFKRPIAGGIAMGAAGAVAGTYGGFYLRKALTKGTGWPDLPVALAGDVAAVGLAVGELRRLAK